MGEFLRYKGLKFYVPSNDHLPRHVHVRGGGGEAKIELEPIVRLVKNEGFGPKDLKVILQVCEVNRENFIDQWNDQFDEEEA